MKKYKTTLIALLMAAIQVPFILTGGVVNVVAFVVCMACAGYCFAITWGD